MEIWKDVPEFEGKYQVSNLGRVKSLKRKSWNGYKLIDQPEKILKQMETAYGYYMVNLWKDNKVKSIVVHRLVSICFLPNPEKKRTVNHIDGNKKNNRLENLEWATYSENRKHAVDYLGHSAPVFYGKDHWKSQPIINLTTGKRYECKSDALKDLKMAKKTLNRALETGEEIRGNKFKYD